MSLPHYAARILAVVDEALACLEEVAREGIWDAIARGAFADDESVVLYITGNAYKGTVESRVLGPVVAADADEFRAAYADVLA